MFTARLCLEVSSGVAVPLDAEKDSSVDRPETHFAWNGGIALAYQVLGEGPVDLLCVQG
jgi:hypothetical protein